MGPCTSGPQEVGLGWGAGALGVLVSDGCGWRAGQALEPRGGVGNDGFSLAAFLLQRVDGSRREEKKGGSELRAPAYTASWVHWLLRAPPPRLQSECEPPRAQTPPREGSRVKTPHNCGGEAPAPRSLLAELSFLALHPSLQMLAVPLEARVLPAALLRAPPASSGLLGST